MEKDKKTRGRSLVIFTTGLALFATYFGAGNLVFPPMLGFESGTGWAPAIIGLAMSGIFLPVIAMVVIETRGSVEAITSHVHSRFYDIIIGAIMFIVLFVANPRTAATAIEVGIQGIFPNVPYIPLVAVYFLIVFFMAKDKGHALDRIGKYLTPAMAIILFILIAIGVVNPIGDPVETALDQHPFVHSFLGGYNTGDVLVSFLLASVFLGGIEGNGFTGSDRKKVTRIAAIIAFCGLFVVYGGLLYMGACGSGVYETGISRTDLLKNIIYATGGRVAIIGFGCATTLACLTTAIGQADAATDYFVHLSKGKFNYKITMAVVCIISACMAVIGVDRIVMFSTPIYGATYPVVLALLILGVFQKVIPNDGCYKGAILCTAIFSISEGLISVLNIGFLQSFVAAMPLSASGFGWVAPFLVGFLLGGIIYRILKKDDAGVPDTL